MWCLYKLKVKSLPLVFRKACEKVKYGWITVKKNEVCILFIDCIFLASYNFSWGCITPNLLHRMPSQQRKAYMSKMTRSRTPSLRVIWLLSSAWSRSPPTREMQGHRHRCTRSPRDHVMELPRRRHHIIGPSHHRRLLRAALGRTAVRIYLTTIWIWITRPWRRTWSKEGRGGGAKKGEDLGRGLPRHRRSGMCCCRRERERWLGGRECRWGRESELGFVAAYMGFTAGAYVEVLGKQRRFSPLVSLWTGSDIFSPSVQ